MNDVRDKMNEWMNDMSGTQLCAAEFIVYRFNKGKRKIAREEYKFIV